MHRAYIGLGANLEQPLQQLRGAVSALALLPDSTLHAVSPLYGSTPVGPQDQPDYLNAVARLDTRLTPHALLRAMQAIELDHGRTRRIRWGARTLDLDLLLFAEDIIRTTDLTVPHPELSNRVFVVQPLLALDARLCLPSGQALQDLPAASTRAGLALLAPAGWWQ